MDYDHLRVSDGTGDAVLMHIESDRLTGATTLDVDSVVNVPTKFIATAGTPLATNFIDPTTKIDFTGHLSGSDLIIDDFEPGSVDVGNTEGQIVIIKPNTGWADRVATFIEGLSGITSPDSTVIDALSAIVMPLVYPIGSLYTNATDSTNPATLLGFGTWVAYAGGRVVMGAGTSDAVYAAGATGGSSTHWHWQTVGADTGAIYVEADGSGTGHTRVVSLSRTLVTGGGVSHAIDGIREDGTYDASSLSPYVVAYIWRRTA